MPPSISVVIPFYNGSRFITEALDTVRAQTLAPVEIIVVDDCSRPEEAAKLDRAAPDCVVIHQPKNGGPSIARNVGIGRARGEWIAFLDCDDLWDPRKLELQAAVAEANPECRAVHCDMKATMPDGSERLGINKGEIAFEDFLVFPCPIFPSAVLMHRGALIEAGLFDPTKRCCEDLDLFLRFTFAHGKFYSVPEHLVIRRVQDDGLSRNTSAFWREADRVYRDFLSVFADRDKGREALRSVHTDMVLRTVYARDFKLMWKMLGPATKRDVPMWLVLARAFGQIVKNRLGKPSR